jgi:hypothetical protein
VDGTGNRLVWLFGGHRTSVRRLDRRSVTRVD